MNGLRNSAISNGDCRKLLRFALSQISVSCPAGLFSWLEETYPKFHAEVFVGLAGRIDAAWGTPHFEALLQDFLYAISVAKAMFELSVRGGRGAIS